MKQSALRRFKWKILFQKVSALPPIFMRPRFGYKFPGVRFRGDVDSGGRRGGGADGDMRHIPHAGRTTGRRLRGAVQELQQPYHYIPEQLVL
jgi:hypothetical protein